ncbi:MAG: glycerophosphodiester phosphodiesterase, partial [Candidatus Thorarchaeota archaeon]
TISKVKIITNDNESEEVLIIAHRGASNIAPPNSIKAFQKAIELKADFIEFDVHQSKDHEIVIIHDNYITNINGQKKFVKDMELNQLKAIDIGEGENIPTLKELIKIAKGKIWLQCEIKAPNLSKVLVKILIKENLTKSSIISSFMFNELLEFQRINSDLKLALLIPPEVYSVDKLIKYCQKAVDNNFYAVHPCYTSINKEFVKFIHDHDMLVNVWTVNIESDIKKVLQMHVDGIISDDIQLVKKLLNQR